MASPPPLQVALARKYGQQYGVDPRLLLAIGGHETQWGTTGAGRPGQGGFVLGYGVTDSGILNKYRGIENQYRYGASTLANWGVHGIADIMAGKASRWATDPAWEKGVQGIYGSLGGQIADAVAPPTARTPQGRPPKTLPGFNVTQGAPRTVMQRQWDPQAYSQGIFSALAGGGIPDFGSLAQTSFKNVPMLIPGAPKRTPMSTKGLPVGGAPAAAPPGARPGLVGTAAKQLGQPYIWGAESRAEGGFDCSGLIDWAARQRGYTGQRLTTWNIATMGKSVKGQPLKPGDLVISNNGKHVSIYAGNGKCLVSPHTGSVVQYQNLDSFSGVTDVRRTGL